MDALARQALSVEAVMDVAARSCGRNLAASSPSRSMTSMRLARRSTRCSPCCWRDRRMQPRSAGSPSSTAMRRRLGRAHLALAQAAGECERGKDRARVFQPLHWSRTRRVASLRARTISPAFSTSGRWRDCARIFARTALNAPKDRWSRGSRCHSLRDHGRTGRRAVQRPRPGMQQQFFERHLAPWIGRFFADLERAEAAEFYRQVGKVGRLFMEIETEAFALPRERGAEPRRSGMKEVGKATLGRRQFLACAWRSARRSPPCRSARDRGHSRQRDQR